MAVESGDEDDLSINEQAISASEDEEGSDDERKHKKLLEAISSMGGRKRKKQSERSEASVQVSEFFVNAEGTGEKVNISDLLGTVEKTSGAANKTKKQLRNLQNSKGTLALPLNKQQTEKIQRGIAYEKTTKEVSCWQNIIVQNQKAEQIVFPLNQESLGPKQVEQVVAGWKAQTPLEQEIFRLLHSNSHPVNDPVLTPVEEASLKAMSLEEAKIRRAELQKTRALQSYYEAKAKREKNIKSKKYHKIQKKGKRKEFLKQFEEMVKTNPEGALEELKKMELSRMEERMSLKHQNSGKWAKSKAIMAKYDDSARKAMQEQLQMNKDLTQKIVVPSDDEHESNEEGLETVPDFVNDPEPIIDPVNPWMRVQLTHEEPEVSCVTTDEPQTAEQENEEEELIGEFERKRKLRQADEEDLIPTEEQSKRAGLKKILDHGEQISIIKEAFAGDDVISDFIKDKRKQEAAGKPKVVDLTLPGWGEWGGVGLKPSRWKRKRFRIKMASSPPRQDRKLPDTIISENRNTSIASHQVSQLPFPFQNTAQFESCIRTPIGQTWNTQGVVKKMTKPKVITKLGAIIAPMVKEDFINKTTTSAGKGPAIMLGENKRANKGREWSSAKHQGRRGSQKRKKQQT
uniref:U3 small nucleolar RNA-associated protein 14 homolog A-like n=1 Tax=Sinocyclocheilus anshuiensis TaxID=1608454 RepID=A0A671RJW0_9TELE